MNMESAKRPLLAPSKSTRHIDFCESQSSVSLADHRIGSVRVDCCFLLSKTKWGMLDGRKVGLMYVDLTFHQPEGCKLASATVTMTFLPAGETTFDPNLEVTEYFGPQALTGEKIDISVSKKGVFQPDIEAMGVTMGGIGFEKNKEFATSARWRFEGKRFPADETITLGKGQFKSSRYRQLLWQLDENQLEEQTSRHHTVHTGLVFEHESEPFRLNLKVKGKLKRRHQRFVQKLLFPPRSRLAHTTALIEAGKLSGLTDESLAALAYDLNQTMVQRNNHPVTEVSNPRPMSDQQALPRPDAQNTAKDKEDSPAGRRPSSQTLKSNAVGTGSSPGGSAVDTQLTSVRLANMTQSPPEEIWSLAAQLAGKGGTIADTLKASQLPEQNGTLHPNPKMQDSNLSEITTVQVQTRAGLTSTKNTSHSITSVLARLLETILQLLIAWIMKLQASLETNGN